jgi:hypothetical protein
MQQTRKLVYAAGWRNRLPSACRDSLQIMTCECIKDSTIGKMADIGTFVVTEGNVAQTAL